MRNRILRQKLMPPPAWDGTIARPRLDALLEDALADGAHVGLFAGTGYGKTAWLAGWARDKHAAWLTLDAEDTDLDAFLAYLIAAFEQALPGFRTEAAQLLGRAREREGAFATLSALIADLDEQGDRPVTLVIDDYHLAASPSLDALTARLLRYLPPAIRLVLLSRKPPDVELAMLQAQRQLRVLDEPALAFDLDELGRLRPESGPAELADLQATTGGWPAAMGMAPELMDAFLDEQLLGGLVPELQGFVQRVAVVDAFDAPLCEEALGEAFTRERRETLLLERLITPRGRDRYVLHPALRNLLYRRFQADTPRDARQALLRRVGDYYWRTGQNSTGLRFWIDAGETAWAADKLVVVAEDWLAAGRLDALASALGGLGAEAERPELLWLQGELARRWGDFARADQLFERAATTEGAVRARARLAQAQVAAGRGDVALAKTRLGEIGGAQSELASFKLDVGILEGGLALLCGETEGAIARFSAAIELGRRLADPYAEARATHNLGICYIRQGEFQRALECYDLAGGITAEDGTPLVWMSPINRALVLIHLERLAEAEDAAAAALALVRRYKLAREEGYALRILGFAQLRKGAWDAASSSFAAAELLAHRANDRLGLAYSLNFRAELALARGEVAAALALVDEAVQAMGGPEAAGSILEFGQVRAKILLAGGRAAEAHPLMDELLQRAAAQGYTHVLRETERLAAGLSRPATERAAAVTGPAELTIRCFGGLRVFRPDGEIPDREWQTARAKQLLAYFLFAPDGANKSQLLDTVFPGEDISNDLMNMTLMRLRKALEPNLEKGQPSRYILRADGRYAFNRQTHVALDTEAFEAALRDARTADGQTARAALERALDCYRGDFLDGLDAAWAELLRQRFQDQALGACRRLLEIYDESEPSASAELLRRALEIDPVSEEFNRELILRYVEAQEHHQALQHFKLCERRYREILNLPPPADLAGLVARS